MRTLGDPQASVGAFESQEGSQGESPRRINRDLSQIHRFKSIGLSEELEWQCHESRPRAFTGNCPRWNKRSRAAIFDDGLAVLHLGGLASPDFRVPAGDRLYPLANLTDPQCLPGRGDRRDVLQQPIRRSKFRRRKIPRL